MWADDLDGDSAIDVPAVVDALDHLDVPAVGDGGDADADEPVPYATLDDDEFGAETDEL